MTFADTFCVVTGATSGIGYEFARRFAAAHAHLLITGRREALLEERKGALLEAGARGVRVITGPLEKQPEPAAELLEAIGDFDGHPLGAVVNNVGFGNDGPLADNAERSLEMLRVQAELPLRVCARAVRAMRRHRAGFLVNVGSLAGRAAVPGSATYVSTKIFLERLSETMALEEADAGIVVQALTPGYVITDFHRDVEGYEDRRVNRGLIRWLRAQDVVGCRFRALRRAERRLRAGRRPIARDVVVVPGYANRLLAGLAPIIPRSLVYRAAENREKL